MPSTTTSPLLAIVIPYYKDRYISSVLRSIEQQTNQRFVVYIGDDCSPHNIQPALGGLTEQFKSRIVYHRFDTNMGSVSLTGQWERCIALSHNEPYIWLFSDDDLMPHDAVERFYDFIAANNTADLLRFNLQIINDTDQLLTESKPHPTHESARDFLYRRLNGECISTACEYLFTRKVYEQKKGFVEFPLAWASDDATWANFAEEKGIYTIPGKPVSWRLGGFNISSDKSGTYKLKIKAALLYLRFIEERYSFPSELKMKTLYAQLSLLGGSQKVKAYFYKEVFKSKLFSNSFLLKQMAIRNYKLIKRGLIKLKLVKPS